MDQPAELAEAAFVRSVQYRPRREKKQARLKAGVKPIVFLYVVLKTAEQKRPTQQE